MVSLNVAVVGGGINGLCTAWALAASGHRVTLFERNRLMEATSSASSKLLHGGLRYLETGEFRLVREALIERGWWLRNRPELTHRLELTLPVYSQISRSPLLIGAGLGLYSLLAGNSGIGGWSWVGAKRFVDENPLLKSQNLRGGFRFYDGQMNDYRLGMWVADTARAAGVTLLEGTPVERVATDGALSTRDQNVRFDLIINCAGPWASLVLEQSSITPSIRIDWVRGSHLLVARPCETAYMLQVPGEKRIFFVLPYEGQTMIGTTEVAQRHDEPIAISEQEVSYLLDARNAYFRDSLAKTDISATFSGVRPLLAYSGSPTSASREYILERQQRLLTVYGGKWTTARALGRKVCDEIAASGLQPHQD